MVDIEKIDYSQFDRPEILMNLFHPRPEWGTRLNTADSDLLIPVEDDIVIGACFHMIEKAAPNILFFHGNGEIVSDYDEMAPLYNRININFLIVDYRGYGQSSGSPSVTNMMRDCHTIFEFSDSWLQENNYTGPFIPMGRSLGSASALELSVNHQDRIGGLIIESGFAFERPLLELLGVDPKFIDIKEKEGFRHLEKIKNIVKPTLIIHAENDHIIPFADGQALFDACRSAQKKFLKIPRANHNDIFMRAAPLYLDAIKELVIQAD
ncbi:MAG: alpha/beta hydrolase [Desulfobacterales bacterium]|nr:MAG: alpha/beta hydrolase [Desulfobacterales bacterium]